MINIIYADYLRTVLLFVLFLFLFLISFSDIKKQQIPDLYIGIIGITGVILEYEYLNIEIKSVIYGMLSIGIFMILCAMVWKKSFGGGDIKLMRVSSGFLGFKGVWTAFLLGVILAFPQALYIKYSGKKDRYFPIGQYLCIGIFVHIIRIVYKG